MIQQVKDHQLQFDNDKFMITKRLYLELLAETNYIIDYEQCRKHVRSVMSKSGKEIKQVRQFETKKIHIESTSAEFGTFRFITKRRKINEVFICKVLNKITHEGFKEYQISISCDEFINVDNFGSDILLIVSNIQTY